ncbi:MAG: DNA internalization-related competence protein ComEC/Rec2 [Lachnospiraceae bacterium]|nr:DNA internalization-related competence protein ComEC/Rec2 [Lachnospiraceae bacterium]
MIEKIVGRLRARPICLMAICLIGFLLIKSVTVGLYKTYPIEKKIQPGCLVSLVGTVSKSKSLKGKTILTLDNSYILMDSNHYLAGSILFYSKGNEQINMGAFVYATGEVAEFPAATNPGQFDERKYYKSLGFSFQVEGSVEKVNNEGKGGILSAIYSLRGGISEVIDRSLLSPDEKALVKAMLLGDKTELTHERKDIYRNAGIIHIITVSGLHITMIGLGLFKLLRKLLLTRTEGAVISTMVVLGYVVMSGLSVSAIRAFIMFIILMGGEVLGRCSDGLTSLSAAAILILLGENAMLFNPTFILSFGTTLGVVGVIPLVPEMENKIYGRVLSGFVLWLFILPILAIFYYEIPTYSVIANLLVIPIVPLLVTASALGGIVGLTLGFDGVFWISKVLLIIVNGITEALANLPGSEIIVGKPCIVFVILYYTGLIGAIHLSVLRKDLIFTRKKPVIAGFYLMTLLAILSILLIKPTGVTTVTFLDVGQGDSIVIQCANGAVVMIDVGSGNVSGVGEKRIIPFLKYSGIKQIDRMILTHPDADHINALDEIMASRIIVKDITIAKVQAKDEKMVEIQKKISDMRENSDKNAQITYAETGTCFSEGDTVFKILAPRGDSKLSDNEASLVTEMSEKGRKLLFTGDVEGEGEEQLLESELLEDVDVLKVAHHGSRNSTPIELLKRIKPEVSVISCALHNSYGHPHKETIDRLRKTGCRIYSTSKGGAVTVGLYNDIRISTYT